MERLIHFLGDLSPRTTTVFLGAIMTLLSGAFAVDAVVRGDTTQACAIGTSFGSGMLLTTPALSRQVKK